MKIVKKYLCVTVLYLCFVGVIALLAETELQAAAMTAGCGMFAALLNAWEIGKLEKAMKDKAKRCADLEPFMN